MKQHRAWIRSAGNWRLAVGWDWLSFTVGCEVKWQRQHKDKMDPLGVTRGLALHLGPFWVALRVQVGRPA